MKSIMYYVLCIMQKSLIHKNLLVFVLPIILATYFLIQTATPAFAQESTPSTSTPRESKPTPEVFQSLPTTVSPVSPLYTDLLIHNIFHTFSCLGIGQSIIGQPCLTYQLQKNAQGMMQGVPMLASVDTSGGVLGTTTGLIGLLYTNRPVRTVDYLASIGEDLGIVKQANAQVVGSGAQVLNPIRTLWQVSRNISYVIMIIIFLIIGLMVMFRTKINPQTVITAQAALPGLVIGLIMITFSYFLAGLISDMAFVGTNIVGYYFQAAQDKPPQDLVGAVSQRSILSLFTPFTRILNVGNVSEALNSIWGDLGDPNINFFDITQLDPQRVIKLLTTFIAFQLFSPVGSLVPGFGQAVIGGAAVISGQFATLTVASFSLAFIGMLALLYAMLRLLLRLINNFLTIIFLTITAPFQFLFASLPGRQGIATNWILNMLANILAFPAVLVVLYFVAFILGPNFRSQYCDRPQNSNNCPFQVSQNQIPDNGLTSTAYAQATIVDSSAFPLFGGLNLDFIRLLLAFGALIALPAIPDIIARSIGTLSQTGQLLGQEIGTATGAGQRYAGQVQEGIRGGVGQVGRLTNERGWYLAQEGEKTVWKKAGSELNITDQARLVSAGQFTKLRGTVGSWVGKLRGK